MVEFAKVMQKKIRENNKHIRELEKFGFNEEADILKDENLILESTINATEAERN